MKKMFLIGIMLVMNSLANAQSTIPTNVMTLNGTWDLYENTRGKIRKTSVQSMNIMTFDGNTIVVQGVSPGDIYWIGLGEISGSEGYFDYRFNDGRYGQTTFKVDKKGNLDALSLNLTTSYKYLAKKRN